MCGFLPSKASCLQQPAAICNSLCVPATHAMIRLSMQVWVCLAGIV